MRLAHTIFALVLSMTPAAAQGAREVIWAHPAGAYYWGIFSAMDQGFIKEEGIKLEESATDNPAQAMQMLVTGAVNVISMSPEVAITAIEKGAEITIVATENRKVGWSLIVRPEIKVYGDLKGKLLGVTQLQEASGTMLKILLEKNGVKESDYDVVPLGGTPNRFAALSGGAVSATLLSPPMDIRALGAGMRKLGDTFEAFSGAGVFLVANKRWAAANGDTLERFLRAATRGGAWLFEPANKDKAADVLVKTMKITREDADKNYELLVGSGIIARTLNIGEGEIEPWLKLRGSNDKPSRYFDAAPLQRALAR